uniref:NUC153 domain-containing protein n=1 Tax=Elaeophora elaphi TaxID=1147741 RepID=A0A0R3RN10_9BILA
MQEVLPDPLAERVVPKIDAVKEKYEQKKACEVRGRRRKQLVEKELKREGSDVRKFFSQKENGAQENQSRAKIKQRKPSKEDDQSDEKNVVEELSLHDSSDDSVVALPHGRKKDTNKKDNIEKIKGVQRNVAPEGKKNKKKGSKQVRIEKAKQEHSSPVMRMEDFFETDDSFIQISKRSDHSLFVAKLAR